MWIADLGTLADRRAGTAYHSSATIAMRQCTHCHLSTLIEITAKYTTDIYTSFRVAIRMSR